MLTPDHAVTVEKVAAVLEKSAARNGFSGLPQIARMRDIAKRISACLDRGEGLNQDDCDFLSRSAAGFGQQAKKVLKNQRISDSTRIDAQFQLAISADLLDVRDAIELHLASVGSIQES